MFMVTFGDYAADWQPAVYGLALLTLVVGWGMASAQRRLHLSTTMPS